MGHQMSSQVITINDNPILGHRVKKPKYKMNVTPIHHHDYDNPFDMPMVGAPGPVYKLNDVLTASRQEKDGRKMRNKRCALFEQWLQWRRVDGLYAPTWEQLKRKFDKKRFSALVLQYAHWRFNFTKNLGKTIDEDIRSVRYLCSLNGIFVTSSDFPWRSQYLRGCDEISRHAFGKPPREKKYALLNPMIEAMINVNPCDEISKLGCLLAQRFCLRSQHYCFTSSKHRTDIMTYGNVYFTCDNNDKVLSMTWRNSKDKNHPVGTHPMDRTIFCTCETEWTCLPCFAYEFIEFNKSYLVKDDDDALFAPIGSDEPMSSYNWYKMTKKLVKNIGLDPSNYSLHSYRSGGTSEKDIEGCSPLDIQYFGHWETLESVYEYIRLGQPDMIYFWTSMEEYIRYRRNQAGLDREQLRERLKQIDKFNLKQMQRWKQRKSY